MKKSLLLLIIALLLSGCQLLGRDETTAPAATQVSQDSPSPTTAQPDEPAPTLKATATDVTPVPPSATPVPTETQPPAPVVQRIQFAPAAISSTQEGALAAGQEHHYVFNASAGQTARVELISTGTAANFSLAAMDDSPPYKSLEDPARSWQGTLPGTQEYTIIVTAPQATTYSLNLSIDPLGEPALPVIVDPGSPPADRCIVAHPGSTAVVTVYLGPSTAFVPIAHLGNWAVVLSAENGWHQIQTGPGETGWVRETDVVFAGPCDHVDQPIRIDLPANGSPWRIGRSILPGQAHRYVFEAEAGKRLLVDLNSTGLVNFALLGVDDGQPLKRVVNEDRTWEGILPRTQEYILTVVPGDAAAKYELLVALQPAPPLAVIYDAHTDTILGGFKDALWVDSETAASALLGGEFYGLFQLGQLLGQGTGSGVLEIGGICPGYRVQLMPPAEPSALAVTGATWAVAPQLVAPVEMSQLERQAVADFLAGQGLAITAGELAVQEAYGAELDGDGLGEIVVVAARLKDDGRFPAVDAGDYVLAAILMEIGGQLHVEPLVLDVYSQADDLAYPWRYTVSGVLELNGDGNLEVVLAGDRWEGKSATVFSVGAAGGSVPLLESRCAE
ncbi:MAG TPA: hypothetical protein VLE70_17175 [Anaerolineae bacterium]|nr:hypothetical protein [Anaerolineae bacterium]